MRILSREEPLHESNGLCADQHEVRHAVGVPSCVLQRKIPVNGVPQHCDRLEAEVLAYFINVLHKSLDGDRLDGRAGVGRNEVPQANEVDLEVVEDRTGERS